MKIFQNQSQECNKYFAPTDISPSNPELQHPGQFDKTREDSSDWQVPGPPLLTILLRPHRQPGRRRSLASTGLGRHPDVVESVGVEVLQDVLRGVRVIDSLVVGELLKWESEL